MNEKDFIIEDGKLIKYKGTAKNIVIPFGVTEIRFSAFHKEEPLSGNGLIESVIIPCSVTKIDDGTFYACHQLKNVTLPNNINTIGFEFFSFCSSLTEIVIPESVTEIRRFAFESCEALKRLEIKGDLEKAESLVFHNTENIKEIICSENTKKLLEETNNIPVGCKFTIHPLSERCVDDLEFITETPNISSSLYKSENYDEVL
jgi:hypothetical protein